MRPWHDQHINKSGHKNARHRCQQTTLGRHTSSLRPQNCRPSAVTRSERERRMTTSDDERRRRRRRRGGGSGKSQANIERSKWRQARDDAHAMRVARRRLDGGVRALADSHCTADASTSKCQRSSTMRRLSTLADRVMVDLRLGSTCARHDSSSFRSSCRVVFWQRQVVDHETPRAMTTTIGNARRPPAAA